jgi:hypothetical protein
MYLEIFERIKLGMRTAAGVGLIVKHGYPTRASRPHV